MSGNRANAQVEQLAGIGGRPGAMLSIAEVARQLGVSGHTAAKLIRRGAIQAFRPGEGMPMRIRRSELERFRERTGVAHGQQRN